MRKTLLSLAVTGMALSLVQAAHAQESPQPGSRVITPGGQALLVRINQSVLIAEAYPASSGTYAPDANDGRRIRANRRWCGPGLDPSGEDNTKAAPGALALCTRNAGGGADFRQRIDINAFARCPSGFKDALVQSYRLTKVPAASRKCPGVFPGGQTFIQFGSNIRTWWTLIYTAPGTTFTLELTVRCVREVFPFDVELHIDRYVWTVDITFDSLKNVIHVLHSNSLSTSEIPCIAAENMYIALLRSAVRIERALQGRSLTAEPLDQVTGGIAVSDPLQRRVNAQNEIFNMEALVIAFCAFGDCFESTPSFPGGVFWGTNFPPSNDTTMSLGGMITGVLDTPENPCCCKLLVDIEKLAERYGIVSL